MNRAFRFCYLTIAAASLAAGPTALPADPAAPADASITGTWPLSQAENAGGELRLHPDGRYDWAVSAGRVNRSSAGAPSP